MVKGHPSVTSSVKDDKIDESNLEKTFSTRAGVVEDVNLDRIGLHAETTRDISPLAIIGIGWNICNSWAAVAATMVLSIANGGPVTLLYGLIVIFILGGSSAATMAELASVYPTAGGQYHWTSILSPKRWSRILSYWCGAINLFGWVILVASFVITLPTLITGLATFWNPSYSPRPWQLFLIFQFFNFAFLIYNIFLMKRTNWIHDIGFVISLIGFVVIFITCLAISNPKQSSNHVWTTFINSSGWTSNGVVFLTGLVNPNFIYSGLDGAIHLAEECKNASKAVPWALVSTVSIGFVTAFGFAVAMTYSYTDFEAVLASPVPILEIWYQATRSSVAATIFLVIVMICASFAIIGAQQTASRLTWSFARDDAVIGSRWLSQIHPKLGVPVWALLINSAIVFIMGCIYLGSSAAFNAMIGSSLILQQISFAFPAAILLYRKRSSKFLPNNRYFKLGLFGWIANCLTIVIAILALIFYDFPAIIPVTASNMNYACAVIGIIILLTIANWFLHAKKRYHGPRMK